MKNTLYTVAFLAFVLMGASAKAVKKPDAFTACVRQSVNYGDVLECSDVLNQSTPTQSHSDGKDGQGLDINSSVTNNQATTSL